MEENFEREIRKRNSEETFGREIRERNSEGIFRRETWKGNSEETFGKEIRKGSSERKGWVLLAEVGWSRTSQGSAPRQQGEAG